MRHERQVQSTDAFPIIQRLTEVRLAWGLTSADMAQRVGCARATFIHWESGDAHPSLKALIRWAHILGYELSLKLEERS